MDELPYAVYAQPYEAPEPFRKLEDALLSLEHINYISKRAYELGESVQVPERHYSVIERDKAGNEFVVEKVTPAGTIHTDARNAAIAEFKKLHHVQNGVWVRNVGN
jgi:hypothetical protein